MSYGPNVESNRLNENMCPNGIHAAAAYVCTKVPFNFSNARFTSRHFVHVQIPLTVLHSEGYT